VRAWERMTSALVEVVLRMLSDGVGKERSLGRRVGAETKNFLAKKTNNISTHVM
jgi:hypothetical protein